ncbi:hypothetical protein Taro_021475 [Colocasia esculenta]|uniref:Uncharacterized protein n=1 Tax=Colocasia esculenta TaxID=4460 RepID=A0A843V5G3_COLES|nr:hypothetical protein [Colocasia esculenta]
MKVNRATNPEANKDTSGFVSFATHQFRLINITLSILFFTRFIWPTDDREVRWGGGVAAVRF